MKATRRGFIGTLLASPLLARISGAAPPPPLPLVAVDTDAEAPLLAMLRFKARGVDDCAYDMPGRPLEHGNCNYTQIVRTPFGRAGEGPAPPADVEARWFLGEHMKSIEWALFTGEREKITGQSGMLRTYTGGIQYFCRPHERGANLLAVIGHNPRMMRWGLGGTEKGNATKFLFVQPSRAASMGVKEAVLRTGRVIVVPTPVLNALRGEMAFLLDINHLWLAELRPSFALLSGPHAKEYFSDCGLGIEEPEAHTVFRVA